MQTFPGERVSGGGGVCGHQGEHRLKKVQSAIKMGAWFPTKICFLEKPTKSLELQFVQRSHGYYQHTRFCAWGGGTLRVLGEQSLEAGSRHSGACPQSIALHVGVLRQCVYCRSNSLLALPHTEFAHPDGPFLPGGPQSGEPPPASAPAHP